MDTIPDWVAFLLSLSFLGYSAHSDWRTREVTDRVWMIYLPISAVIFFSKIALLPHLLSISLIAVFVMLSLSFLMYYLGLFGGADAKALICLSVALPVYPFSKLALPSFDPLFSLAVLYNGYFFSLSTVLYVAGKNLAWKYTTRRMLFHGYERVSIIGKAVALFTGYKTCFRNLKEKSYLYPMEDVTETVDGLSRRIRVFALVKDDRDCLLRNLGKSLEDRDEVWVTPGTPLLVFVFFGFLSTALFGDILLWLGMRIALVMMG